MDNTLGDIGIICVLIAITAFMNATEIAIVSVRRTRIKHLADEGHRSAQRVQKLLDNPRAFIATVQVGVTLTNFFASAFGAISLVEILTRWLAGDPFRFSKGTADTISFVVVTVAVAFLSLIFGELVPKTLGIERAEAIALRVSTFVTVLSRVTWPAVRVLTGTTNFVVRLLGGHRHAEMSSITEEEIISMIGTGEAEGEVTTSEQEMIENIFEFTDRRVSDVMVPRPDIFELPADLTIAEAGPRIRQARYSRIPVYQQDRENITGMVLAKDVLAAYVEGQTERTLGEIAHLLLFVPETKLVGELLREMQRERQNLAIAIDEYGGVSGMLTLEDLLEEIVGEIRDETEQGEAAIQRVNDQELLVAGTVPLREIVDELDLRVRDGDQDRTVAALILEMQGRIPDPGDEAIWHGLTFTVVEVQRHRIQKVRVQVPSSVADELANTPGPPIE